MLHIVFVCTIFFTVDDNTFLIFNTFCYSSNSQVWHFYFTPTAAYDKWNETKRHHLVVFMLKFLLHFVTCVSFLLTYSSDKLRSLPFFLFETQRIKFFKTWYICAQNVTKTNIFFSCDFESRATFFMLNSHEPVNWC